MGRARPRTPHRSSFSTPSPRTGRTSRNIFRALGVAALVAGGIWLAWAASRLPATPARASLPPPDVLLITLDTTRADRLGSYGYAGAATPNLDRLARDGVRFERALSSAPITLPAHATLLTGRQPFSHGVRNNGHFVLPEEVPTLATVLAARGYDTAAFVSSFVLDRQFGLARGFAHYDDGLDPGPTGSAVSLELERRGDRTVAAATRWLAGREQPSTRPYFLWVHLYDAHDPYVPPEPYRQRFAGRPYDGEVAFADAVVGDLLQAVGYGTPRGPLVVVAGDHGESLGEHGESTHGLFVYDSAIRVPLILAWPGVVGPAVLALPVRLVDLAPTIVDLAGTSLDAAEGRSLVPLLDRGEHDADAPVAYSETYFPEFFMQWASLRAIEAGRWKYIDAPEPELYDLGADPAEQVNLAGRESARVTSLKRVLDGMAGAGAGRLASTPLTSAARERLASLGYLSATAPAPTRETAALPDPKRMVSLFEKLLDGNRALARGEEDQAAAIARDVLARDGGNAFARLLQGRAALASGRNQEAVTALKAYAALVPGSADAHHWMALAHLRMGERDRALAEEEATLAIDPRHAAALSLKAGLLFSGGHRQEGLRVLRTAADRDPSNLLLRLELADLLTDAGRFSDAEGEYRQVIEARAGDSRALLGLALVLSATGRANEALASVNEAVQADPRNDEARFARAEILQGLGQVDAARADYEAVVKASPRPDLRDEAERRLRKIDR